MHPNITPTLLDRQEAAQHLATTERHVRRLIATGRIPAVKVGGKVRIRVADLDAFLGGLPAVGTPGTHQHTIDS